MNGTRWERIEALFELAQSDRAQDQPPEHRRRCPTDAGADDALRLEVEAMLAASHPSHRLAIERFVVDAAEEPAEIDPLLDTCVGPWRLTGVLGRGGMGTVYRAERADGEYRQEAAVKLLRAGPRDAHAAERLRTERQVLAQLVHPNIARLIDGGLAPDGTPFLVMELVDGVPITQWCAMSGASLEARLRLVRVVCDAVQHAHRALVVHRDLKPPNIFVTRTGVVKLLDFGIVKLLDPKAWALEPLATRAELRVLTPEYAAPEQLDHGQVTTATDVYTLGVVLYEILTGRRPAPVGARGDSPIAPSDVVRRGRSTSAECTAVGDGSGPMGPSTAADTRRLARRLRGDLDRIVLTALRDEPERRYASAGQLGEEIGRFLEGRAVLAQPDTLRYRIRRFVGRNLVAVGAAAVLICALAAFGLSAALQARALAEQSRVATLERDKAEQVVRVLVELFEATNPSVRPDGDRMPVGEFLAGAQTRAVARLQSAPEVRARLKQVFGLIDYTRGRYATAREALDEALSEQRRQLGPDHPDALESLHALGLVAQGSGEATKARALLEESLDRHRRKHGEVHEKTARALDALARLEADTDTEKGGALLRKALDIRRRVLPANHPDLASTLGALGIYHERRGEFDQARRLLQEAMAVFKGSDRRHPKAIGLMGDYATVLGQLNANQEAEAVQREAISLARDSLGPDNLTTANLINNLGVTLANQGRHAEAEVAFREAFDRHLALTGEHHWRIRNLARNIGRVLALQLRYAEAVPWMDRALATRLPTEPSDDAGLMGVRAQRASILFRLGHRERAIGELTQIVSALQRAKSAHTETVLAWTRVLLGRAMNDAGRPERGEPALVAARVWVERYEPAHPRRAEVECELARARILQGRDGGERASLARCLADYRRWGLADRQVVHSIERLLNPGAATVTRRSHTTSPPARSR